VGLLAKYFSGGFSIPHQMTLTFKEVFFWFENYELQATEDEIIEELRYDKDGKVKDLPSTETIRKKTLKRMKERREKLNAI